MPCRSVDTSQAAQQTPFKAINLLLAAFFILSLSFLPPRVDNGDSLRTIVATASAPPPPPPVSDLGQSAGRHGGETPFGASKKSYARLTNQPAGHGGETCARPGIRNRLFGHHWSAMVTIND